MNTTTILGHVQRVLTGVPRVLSDRCSTSLGRREVGILDVKLEGVVGDDFGDRKHHGGAEKAVHQYPVEHQDLWRNEMPELAGMLIPGGFGENLSSLGVTEHDLCIGDTVRIGSATLQVSQGRQPCWKLVAYFGRDDMAQRAQSSGRLGWYYRVIEPGRIRANDVIMLTARPHPEWTVDRVHRAIFERQHSNAELHTLAELAGLSPRWQALFAKRLEPSSAVDDSLRLGMR